jgi:hypothetical protein
MGRIFGSYAISVVTGVTDMETTLGLLERPVVLNRFLTRAVCFVASVRAVWISVALSPRLDAGATDRALKFIS